MTVTPPIEDWTLVEIRATLRYNPSGAPIVGYLRFTPTALRSVSVADRAQIAIATTRRFVIGADGDWSASLPATDDPAIIGVDGTPFVYLVDEEFPGGSSYHVSVPSSKAGTGVALGEIAGAQPGIVPGVTRGDLTAAVEETRQLRDETREISGIEDVDQALVVLDADPTSVFRQQADARHSATIATAVTEGVATGVSEVAPYFVAASRARLATRAAYDAARSAGLAQVAHATATTLTEAWADLAAWALASTSVQVSAGKLYGVTGGGGANRAFRVAPGITARVVLRVNVVSGGTSGQGTLVGFSRATTGAAPAAGGAQSRGLYFRHGDASITALSDGAQETPLFTGMGTSSWKVTLTVDENYFSISATAESGALPRIYKRWARDDATFPLNNLTIMVNDNRGTAGASVDPITEARIGALVTGSALTAGVSAHAGSSSGDGFLILTPTGYDSRRPTPAVIVFHGNGSDETHWTTNANGKAVADAFLAQGYIVIAAANTGATSSWGSQAGLDAYVRAYQYARDHYNLGAVVLYGNSMGGIESLLALAGESIPGVAAWMGTVPTYDLAENRSNALFTTTIDAAYGGNYAANSVGRDPALLNPLAFRGVPMWMLLATDDTSVTPGPNGAALYDAVVATNPRTKVEVTGGHSTAQIATNAAEMLAWCNNVLGLRNSYPA